MSGLWGDADPLPRSSWLGRAAAAVLGELRRVGAGWIDLFSPLEDFDEEWGRESIEWAAMTTTVVEEAPEAVRVGDAVELPDGGALGEGLTDAEAGDAVAVRVTGGSGLLFPYAPVSAAYVAFGLPEFTRPAPRRGPRAQRTEDLNVERGIRLEGEE